MSATLPAAAAVEYPDTDGEPMGDNSHQIDLIITLYQALTDHFAGRPDVAVHSNLIWYPVEGRPDVRRAPDVMVAFGRPAGRRRSYKQWEEDGVPPQVVFEVVTPGKRPDELMRAFHFARRHGAEEFYLIDPVRRDVSAWERTGGGWEEYGSVTGEVRPRLGCGFGWTAGGLLERIPGADAPHIRFAGGVR